MQSDSEMQKYLSHPLNHRSLFIHVKPNSYLVFILFLYEILDFFFFFFYKEFP